MKLKRIEAGVYETADGLRRVILTTWYREGPRAGTLYRWEVAERDPHLDGWLINGLGTWRTLREAREALATTPKEGT